jgi:hypothetical protein
MNILDEDYDREGLALFIADILPNDEVESDRVLALAGRIAALVRASRAIPVDATEDPGD